jgi:type I restriction enzyme S subunit
VDVLDWHAISPEFQKVIERGYEVIQEAKMDVSSNGWVKQKLGEVCEKIGSGATPRGGSDVYLPQGKIALIRSQNVYNDGFKKDGLAYITEVHAEELSNVTVESNDVLLNITGDSVARCCQVPDDVLPARVNQHVAIIRPQKDKLDARYLRYYLVDPIMQDYMLMLAGGGATRNALTKGMIESFEILAPSLPVQRAIAGILGALDDKIELNRRMNRTLESMARAVFRQWFVEGEEVGDWEIVPLPEIVEVNPTRSLKKGEVAPYLDMANMPTQGHRGIEWIDRPFGSGTKFVNGDTLLARITPCLENGKTAFVDFLKGGQVGWGSTEYIVFHPKPPLPPEYGYYLARSEELRSHAIQNMTGTSGRQRTPASCFDNYLVSVPPADLAEKFGEFAKSVIDKVRANDEESRTLASLRDSLLPKLMRGEVRVK